MAAKTPSTIKKENLGSLNLIMSTFTDIDDADTYVSGLDAVVDQWFNRTDDPTQGTEGVGVSESSGTFTFNAGEDNITGILFILTKQG